MLDFLNWLDSRILRNSSCVKLRDFCINAGIVDALTSVIKQISNVKLLDLIFGILEYVVDYCYDGEVKMATSEGIESMVYALTKPDTLEITIYRILSMLIRMYPFRKKVANNGGIEAIIYVIQKRKISDKLLEKACRALFQNISNDTVERANQANAVEAMIGILKDPNAGYSLLKRASETLWDIIGESNESLETAKRLGGMEIIDRYKEFEE